MSLTDFMPLIIILIIFLVIVAVIAGIVVVIKKSSFKNGEKEEMNLDLKRRIETLEKEIEDIKKK